MPHKIKHIMKVTFMPGIASISGSMKSPMGKKIIFKHYRSDKTGHGHMYMYGPRDGRRATPVSEREKAARQRFSLLASRVAALTDEQRRAFAAEFKACNGKFRGKQYKILRGYIMARLAAEDNERQTTK